MHKEHKEIFFNVMANEVLPSCFVVATVIPDIILGIGHEKTSFAYQAITSLFLKPILEMHRGIKIESFHLRSSKFPFPISLPKPEMSLPGALMPGIH